MSTNNDAKPGKKNTGLESARAAAQTVGGWLAVPEMDGHKCDFNDLMRECGADAVKHAIERATIRRRRCSAPSSNGNRVC